MTTPGAWIRHMLGLDQLRHRLIRIDDRLEIIMATEADLKADLDKIAAGVTEAVSLIADLKAQIANIPAGAVTQDQLDELTAQADSIVAALTPNTP